MTTYMSLKAKIEAVIYAAEEPVTLAQLAAIFAGEVPTPEALDAAHNSEITVLDASGMMQDFAPETAPRLDSETLDAVSAVTVAAVSEAPDPTTAAGSIVDPEAAAKRAVRLRDREVRDSLRSLIDELIAEYAHPDRGIEIREIAGGYRMATKPEFHDAVRAFVKSLKPVMKLSPQALETLAVIAYKQPVTAPEISEIRGVDSGGVLASLISRKLVTTAGRKQVIGRPILYKTTKEFLLRFGLKDLGELPSTEEFEKMAVELAASEDLEDEALQNSAETASFFEEAATTQLETIDAEKSSSEEELVPETREP